MRNLGIVALIMLAGCSEERRRVGAPEGPVAATVGASKLWGDFGDNEIAAGQKYKDKKIKVAGTVDRIAEDHIGFGVVARALLSEADYRRLPAKERKWYDDGYPPNVVCYLAPGAEKQAALLKKGSEVELVGRCVGKKSGDVFMGYLVVLEGCQVVPAKTATKAK